MVQTSKPPRRITTRTRCSKQSAVGVLILGCFVAIISVNLFHLSMIHGHGSFSLEALETSFRDEHLLTADHSRIADAKPKRQENEEIPANHQLAGLSCETFGGPSPELAQEMVYWQDILSDSEYMSPFHRRGKQKQYMTFEPDGGGWNNIRMSMETVLAMAHAMGRILVLPPEKNMYLLSNKKSHNDQSQKNAFSFNDFFHMDSIASEHRGLEIITMEEFLKREAITGNLNNKTTGRVAFPPGNRTNWDGESDYIMNHEFNPWLYDVAFEPVWNANKCQAAFPSTTNPNNIQELEKMKEEIDEQGGWPSFEDFVGHPTPVDGPAVERMKENGAGRTELCIYGEAMQKEPLIHFSSRKRSPGGRLLVHFYAFLFFQDWRQDMWMKRFVRDHVRYVDEIQCAAARLVHAIREHAREKNPDTNPQGLFDTFHVRRGDFQYKTTRISAEQMFKISEDELKPGSTVYIATDERKKDFFKPLSDVYDVVFLDDFMHLIADLNTNYYGMLDQLIASRGRVFFGCWFSTFTGYINRMRGYHADKLKLPGYKDGLHESYYYALKEHKMKMREFYPVKQAFHAREFPASWRSIDTGIGLLHSEEGAK